MSNRNTIRNTTDIPDLYVRQVLALVRAEFPGLPALRSITIRNRKGVWSTGHYFHDGPRIVCSIGRDWPDGNVSLTNRFPLLKGCKVVLEDRLEAMVEILAHELRHHIQNTRTRYGRYWGSRGKFPERDAQAYSVHILRVWRRFLAEPMSSSGYGRGGFCGEGDDVNASMEAAGGASAWLDETFAMFRGMR